MCMQTLYAINSYLQLYLLVFLVDVVLEESEETEESQQMFLVNFGPHEGRTYTAYLVACGMLLPSLVLWFSEYLEEKLDYKGMLESFLTQNLFTKYLNYDEKSREQVTCSVVATALVSEARDVTEGVVATMRAIQIFEKLLVYLVFAVREAPNVLESTGMMFVLMILGLIMFAPKLVKRLEDLAKSIVEMTDHIQHTCMNYSLISEYKLRPVACDMFKQVDEKVKHRKMLMEISKLHLHRWTEILGPLFIAWHVAATSHDVIDGNISLGMFLASIRMYKELSEIFVDLNLCLQSVTSSLAPLKHYTSLLNLDTDLMQWKSIARYRRECTKIERRTLLAYQELNVQDDEALHNSAARSFRTDSVKIKLSGLGFNYRGQGFILSELSASVSQGSFIAIVGKHGRGKATLMKLLGHSIFPTQGHIFMPSHLRTLFVPQHLSMIEDASAWSNLTFGLSGSDDDRVRLILKKLDMPQTLSLVDDELKQLEKVHSVNCLIDAGHGEAYSTGMFHNSTKDHAAGIQALPYSEKAKVNLARALIMNPEVLVLQRPLANFNETTGSIMFDVIREHIANRGYALPESTCKERRPRTVFMSPVSAKELRGVDFIWEVDQGKGMKCYSSATEITEECLQAFHML